MSWEAAGEEAVAGSAWLPMWSRKGRPWAGAAPEAPQAE